ncbi:MAG: hypothetical protein GX297_00955 [Treponema sp.]|jgi:hypothetical protein|nr:hypothetical protein [Treponema sp.]
MNAEDISRKIHRQILPLSTENLPPVAYICIEVGNNFQFSDDDIRKAFDKIKWDTELSSAELLVLRKPKSNIPDSSVILGGFSFFDDGVDNNIDETGEIPSFCFIEKHIV